MPNLPAVLRAFLVAMMLIACTCRVLPADGLVAPAIRQNSMRGLYEWYRRNAVPLPHLPAETYIRYAWKQLEPERDKYDFSVIDADIERARARGQRLAFRVMPACSGAQALVPDYLVAALPKGVWFDDNRNRTSAVPNTYFPDWNDPLFLDRTNRLIDALGQRYDGNPGIAWVEIGSYGNWGEWHTSPYKYPNPQGGLSGTDDTKRAIVDMYVRAFRRTRLIMMTDDSVGLLYALSKSPTIGIRRDSLGKDWFERGLKQDPRRLAAVQERWKTAPFVTEFFGFGPKDPDLAGAFTLAKTQVVEYHVSAVGNGNMPRWQQLAPDAQAAIAAMADCAGYDLHVSATATVSDSKHGRMVSISASWSNTGSAPVYDPWNVTYVLLPAAGEPQEPVALGGSGVDLRSILPAPEAHPIVMDEQIPLPKSLAPGQYALAVKVTDPSGIRPDMALDEASPAIPSLCVIAHFSVR
ncbi:MAG: DUF4832 domain-containing protein [Capsulimonadaceae bacterium]|nr:DUF4832 domain-containing protein [Capsulimonadaceae bacterium]